MSKRVSPGASTVFSVVHGRLELTRASITVRAICRCLEFGIGSFHRSLTLAKSILLASNSDTGEGACSSRRRSHAINHKRRPALHR